MNWVTKLTLVAEDPDRFSWLVRSSNANFPLQSQTSLCPHARPHSRRLRLAIRVAL